MHDLDKLNRERRGAESAQLEAARAMLAVLKKVDAIDLDSGPSTLLGSRIAYAIAQAEAAGIKSED